MNTNTTDDDVLRGYLLGSLAPESREAVEKRLFSDDRIFWEHLCLVEEELIDDYARGELDGEESERFERNFLCTDERRAKLEFARALKAHVEQHELANRRRAWAWLRGPVASPAWAVAMAAVLLLALPAMVWRFAAAHGPQTEVSAWLSPGLVRDVGGEVKRLPIPPGCQLVRLRLDPGVAEPDGYRATLHEVAGEELWSQSGLRAVSVDGRPAITLTLPCELLPTGDYYVRLRGVLPGGDPEILGRYDFRVLRP
jgi:hypothetical protein